MHFQLEFCQIAVQPPLPPLKQTDALGHIFFVKNTKNLKTAILTLGMDTLTMTMVKKDS